MKKRITKERHNQVTWSGVCPNCGEYRIVTAFRWKNGSDALDRNRKFAGVYFACGGLKGHLCFYMTKDPNASRLYESHGEE